MPVIFISYRRSDSQDVTGRICDRLVAKFTKKEVFRDVDNIPIGISFAMHLQQMLGKSGVVLVIIGPSWLTATDEQGRRRLDDPNDFVRVEVETALRANVPVVPVLVSNARMPLASELPKSIRKLVSRQGSKVRPDPDFNNDIGRLFSEIQHLRTLRIKPKQGSPPASEKDKSQTLDTKSKPQNSRQKRFVVLAFLLLVLCIAVYAVFFLDVFDTQAMLPGWLDQQVKKLRARSKIKENENKEPEIKKDIGTPSAIKKSLLTDWTVIAGRWEIKGPLVKYLGPDDPAAPAPHGLILSKAPCGKGAIETKVRFFGNPKDGAAYTVFGYHKSTEEYYYVGLHGPDAERFGLYRLSDFRKAVGWTPISWTGEKTVPKADVEYRLRSAVSGSQVSLTVNDIKVLEKSLPNPLVGDHVGLLAWCVGPVEFKDTKVTADTPAKVLHGPISGKLLAKPGDRILWQQAGVGVRDCVVQATFINPYDAASAPWAEALFFRIGGVGKSFVSYRVAVDSADDHWAYGYSGEKGFVGKRLKLPTGLLATKKADRNRLMVFVNGNQGQFYLNGNFVGDLDVSGNISAGDAAVAIDMLGYKESAEVLFEDFRVSEFK
jgi:hypothetical protein